MKTYSKATNEHQGRDNPWKLLTLAVSSRSAPNASYAYGVVRSASSPVTITYTHSTLTPQLYSYCMCTTYKRHSLSLHLYTYRRDSRALLIHRACARCSTPSSPMGLSWRLQKRQQRQWSQANMTHWPPGGDTYYRVLRDVLVRNPSAMAFAPCDVTLHLWRLLWRESLSQQTKQAACTCMLPWHPRTCCILTRPVQIIPA